MLDGAVIGRCMQRHRHVEFIRFLNTVERKFAADKSIHVVLDNYATHKHPKMLAWLARHPRWTFHFTPTSASWLNAVENFFSKMTRQRIRRGVFRSVVDLQAAINAYPDAVAQVQGPTTGKLALRNLAALTGGLLSAAPRSGEAGLVLSPGMGQQPGNLLPPFRLSQS